MCVFDNNNSNDLRLCVDGGSGAEGADRVAGRRVRGSVQVPAAQLSSNEHLRLGTGHCLALHAPR